MSSRNKLYYPKTHIVNNLYTSGKELMFEDGTEYIGFYHRYIDGLRMSGAIYQKPVSKKLIDYIETTNQPVNGVYDVLKKKIVVVAPKHYFPIPTTDDYTSGKITRYFIKRRNFSSYEDLLEINEEQFKSWSKEDSGIDEMLYDAISFDWKLTGPKNDVTKNGITIPGVYDTNNRMVQLKAKSFPGLKEFLTDFLELSVYSPYTSTEIKKLFGSNS